MKIIVFALLVIASTVVIFQLLPTTAGASDRESVLKAIEEGALVVDVRTEAEFKRGHFPGALHIPLDQLNDRLDELGDRTSPKVLYCRTGNRSGKAKRILENKGFTDVLNGGGLKDMPRR